MARWNPTLKGLPTIRSVRIERVNESAIFGCYELHLRVFFSGGYCERMKHIWANDELDAVTNFIRTYNCHVTFGVDDEQSSD
jgi:hypothetical protein